jgi:hypothetical protein
MLAHALSCQRNVACNRGLGDPLMLAFRIAVQRQRYLEISIALALLVELMADPHEARAVAGGEQREVILVVGVRPFRRPAESGRRRGAFATGGAARQ